jgi:type VI secretion system secreted protein Hcp
MASSAYLQVDGAEGESTDKGHVGWIDVESWSWACVQPETAATGGGSGAARVSMQPLTVTAPVFKGANTLFLYCCNGKHIPKVVLEMTKAGETQQVFWRITLEDVIVSHVQFGGSGNSHVCHANFSFMAKKNKVAYGKQDKSGTVGGLEEKGWDIAENVKL